MKELDISINELTELPVDLFANLNKLEKLNLSSNQLTKLPETIFFNLPSLKELDLSDNQLKNLPENIFANTPNLERLILSSNILKELPASTSNLKNLREIDFSGNNIHTKDSKSHFSTKASVSEFLNSF